MKFKHLPKKIRTFFNNNPAISAGLVFCGVFLLYCAVYFSNPGISFLDDHFFHFKYAYLIRTQGWNVVDNFKWISISPGVIGQYQLTLYNLALVPFTFFKDLLFGLKISDIFLASLSLSLVYYSFRKFRIDFALFWMLVLLSVEFFSYRMLSGRALVLVPGLLLLELYFAKEKKYAKFFVTACFHVAWHPSTFFLPFVMALMVEAARALDERKISWQVPVAALAAFFVGIKLTLFSVVGLWQGVVGVQSSTNSSVGSAGARIEGLELYPVDIFQMLGSSQIVLLLLFAGFAVVLYYYLANRGREAASRESHVALYSSFLLALMSFAGAIIVSGRFYDYYFPAIIFLFAMAATQLFRERKIVLEPFLQRMIFGSVTLFFMLAVLNASLDIRQSISKNDYRPVGGVASWIAAKSLPGERIFLQNWGYFPNAFFFNSKDVYTMGIEPRGALVSNPQLYWKWYNMFTYGIYCDERADCSQQKQDFNDSLDRASDAEKQNIKKENSRKMIESIRNDFGASFVISEGDFSDILKLNPDLIEDSTSVQSDYTGRVVDGFELK